MVDDCRFGPFGPGDNGILHRNPERYVVDDDNWCGFICTLYIVQRYPF